MKGLDSVVKGVKIISVKSCEACPFGVAPLRRGKVGEFRECSVEKTVISSNST